MGSNAPRYIEIKVIGPLAKLERVLRDIMDRYMTELYRYNELIKSYGYYLKPMHIVTRRTSNGIRRYYYFGKYWYKLSYEGKRGKTSRVKWIYVGRNKPLPEIPDPPPNPLDLLMVKIDNNSIRLYVSSNKMIKKIIELFKGFKVYVRIIQGP